VTPFRKKKTDYSDDYQFQTVCPQHASNFFEPGFLGAWTLNSIFISVAGQARFTATFRFKLENLLLQLAWLFLPIFPFLTSTFYKFLRLPAARNVGSWNKNGNGNGLWKENGLLHNVCPNWTHCLWLLAKRKRFSLAALKRNQVVDSTAGFVDLSLDLSAC